MKKAKFIPLILASALLASCGADTSSVSSLIPSSETTSASTEETTSSSNSEVETSSSSEEMPVSSETSSSSEIVTPSSSEETPVSSETSSSSETTISSSSEESDSASSSSEEPAPSVITSWEQITAGAKAQINAFFQNFDSASEDHKPDDYLPVLPIASSVDWTYDATYSAEYGYSVGVIALTGEDANENKALIAEYNQSIVAKGWAKATDEELGDYNVSCALFGKNVYHFEDSASGATLVAEIIPCADAEGDDMITFSPTDADGNEVTSGILFTVQVYDDTLF